MPWGLVMGEVTLLLTPAEHQPYYRPGAKHSVSSIAFDAHHPPASCSGFHTQQACGGAGECDVCTLVPPAPVGPARWACLLPHALSRAGPADLLTTGQLRTGCRKR